ncbi:MAG: hypothetical protein M3N22_03660, partial [Acidobacteriota bacterium]|nr:hypothetical protein [Acidobacteriota bacterium]
MLRKLSLITFFSISYLLAACGGGNTSTTPIVQAVQVTVQPAAANVSDFRTQQFTATVTGTSNTAVNWQVSGIAGGNQKLGFVSANGLYIAPSSVATKPDGKGNTVTTTVKVTAVSQANTVATNSATVTIVPDNANTQTAPVLLGSTGGNTNDSINTTTNGKPTITCCGGTLGSLVTRGGTQYILSNTHILARSDAATIGDAIIQPGLIDTPTCTAPGTTTVANLSQFFNLQNGPNPKIDAAIAQVVSGKVDPAGKIIYLGATVDANNVPVADAPQAGTGLPVAGIVPNLAVAKSGRSTGLTCSTIEATNISTSVDYTMNCDGTGTKFTVPYTNQIGVIGGDFSAEGDSGSLIVTQADANPVALLYAGSDKDSVGNPVSDVLNFFASGSSNMTFVGGAAHAVVGCTLPTAPHSAEKVVPQLLEASILQKAVATRDLHAPE